MTIFHPAPSDRRNETTTPKQTEPSQSSESLPDVRVPQDVVREARRYLDDVHADGLTCRYGNVTELLLDVMRKGLSDLRQISYFGDPDKSRMHFDSEAVGRSPSESGDLKSHSWSDILEYDRDWEHHVVLTALIPQNLCLRIWNALSEGESCLYRTLEDNRFHLHVSSIARIQIVVVSIRWPLALNEWLRSKVGFTDADLIEFWHSLRVALAEQTKGGDV